MAIFSNEEKGSGMAVAVLIRTKNSEKFIKETLDALFSQQGLIFDVYIIDSSSVDRTVDIVKKYPIHLSQIPAENYFPGQVLNESLKGIDSEIIIFLNSDAVLITPFALKDLIAPFEDQNVVATFARQVPRPNAKTWVKRDYERAFPNSQDAPVWQPFSLCLAAIRRKTWLERPFYTLAWGSEDVEWALWAKSAGYIIKYVANSCVIHSHNYTLKQLYGRRFIEGEADAFMKKSYGFFHFFWDYLRSLPRDLHYYIRMRDFIHMFEILSIRYVYYWAYYKGNRWGKRRQQENNSDAKFGQKTVLSRYDDEKS